MAGMDRVLISDRAGLRLPPFRARGLFLPITLLALGLAGSLLWPPEFVNLPRVENCRLEQNACRADLGSSIQLIAKLGPRPISPMAALTVEAHLEGLRAQRVQASFRGEAMNMGVHEVQLTRREDGAFEGQTRLPVCVTGRMTWEVTIAIDAGRKIYRQAFLFDSGA